MPKPITHSRWVRGLQAGFDRYAQPKGSISRVSNIVYTRRGALKVCDGSQVVSAFGGVIPLSWNPLTSQLWLELFYYAPSSQVRNGYYGLYDDPASHMVGATGTPVLSAVGSASGLTGTYFVEITAVDGTGGESAASAEASQALVAQGLHITWASVPTAYGYNLYISTGSGTEVLWLPAGSLPSAIGVSVIGGATVAVTVDSTWVQNANQLPATVDTSAELVFTSVPPGGYSAANIVKLFPAAIQPVFTGSSGLTIDTSSTPVTSTTQLRPTTEVQGGPNGGVNDFSLTTKAYDSDFMTASTGTDFSVDSDPGTEGTWSGFPAVPAGTVTAIVLNVNSSLVVHGSSTITSNVRYSLNNGVSWFAITGSATSYAQRTNSVSLPLTQDLTQVKVAGFVKSSPSPGAGQGQMFLYEIWCDVTIQTSGGGSSGSGGIGTGGGTPNGGVAGISGPLPMIVSLSGKMILALGNGIVPYQSDGSTAGTTAITNTFTAVYPARIASTAYNEGSQIQATVTAVDYVFTAVQGGVTSAGGPPAFAATLGSTVTDGNIIWKNTGQVSGSPAPRGAAHAEVYAGSLWVANTSPTLTTDKLDGPSALRMSDLNTPTSWNPLNAAQIAPDDGDECNGIKAFTVAEAGIAPQNFLMFFKNFSSYLIQGVFGASNFAITRLQTDLGCVAPRSIQFIPGYGIMRLSHLGFAVTDGISDKLQDPEAIRPLLFPETTETDITTVDWSMAWFSKAAQTVNPPMYVCAMPLVNAGSSLLGTLDGVAASVVANGSATLPTDTYYVQVGLRSPNGISQLSAVLGPFSITSGVNAIQVTTAAIPSGYYGFRVWFGSSATNLTQYVDSNITTINITAPGSNGSPVTGISGFLTRVFCYDLILKAWTVVDLPFAISVLRQSRVTGQIPLTLMAGRYDEAIRQWQAGDTMWDEGAVIAGASSSDVQWRFRDSEVYVEGGTVNLFYNDVFIRGDGGPIEIDATPTVNGRTQQTIAAALTSMGISQFEGVVRVLQTCRNLSLEISGSGPALIESVDYQVVAKPVGSQVIIS